MKRLKRLLILLCAAVHVLAVQAIADDHPDRVVQPGVPQGKSWLSANCPEVIFP